MLSTVVEGRITGRDAIDRLLGTSGKSDAELADAVYERFGTDGFLRLDGRFAITLRDPSDGSCVLARDASGAIPLTYLEGAKREEVPPGAAVILDARGRVRTRPFWTFTPMVPPRAMSLEAAARELEAVLARAIARASAMIGEVTAFYGEPIALRMFERAAGVKRVARERGAITDLGMREVFGGTQGALRAYIEGLAAGIAAEPSARAIREFFARGWRVAPTATMIGALDDALRIVTGRWARRLPPALASRIERRLGSPAPASAATSSTPSYTGQAYVDRRFHETRDPRLIAAQVELTRAGMAAPFLDPEVIELAFSLPDECFIREGRMMRVLAGGVPL